MSEFHDKAAEAHKSGISADDGEKPDIWKPEEGDQLLGFVKEVLWPFIKSADEHRWLLIIEDLDGKKWALWCSGTVLKDLVVQVMPAIGTEIVVTYDGKKESKSSVYSYRAFQMEASQSDPELYHNIIKETKNKDTMRAEMYPADTGTRGAAAGPPDDGLSAPF